MRYVLHQRSTIYNSILVSYHHRCIGIQFGLQYVCVISKMNLVHVWERTFRINVISYRANLRFTIQDLSVYCVCSVHSAQFQVPVLLKIKKCTDNFQTGYHFVLCTFHIFIVVVSMCMHSFCTLYFVLCAICILTVFPLFLFCFYFIFLFIFCCSLVNGSRFCIAHNIQYRNYNEKLHS